MDLHTAMQSWKSREDTAACSNVTFTMKLHSLSLQPNTKPNMHPHTGVCLRQSVQGAACVCVCVWCGDESQHVESLRRDVCVTVSQKRSRAQCVSIENHQTKHSTRKETITSISDLVCSYVVKSFIIGKKADERVFVCVCVCVKHEKVHHFKSLHPLYPAIGTPWSGPRLWAGLSRLISKPPQGLTQPGHFLTSFRLLVLWIMTHL